MSHPRRKSWWQSLFQARPAAPPRRRARLALEVLEGRLAPAASLTVADAPAGVFPHFAFTDPNPDPGGRFGVQLVPLSNGNVVVSDFFDDAGGADAGAVYLFNGTTGALISTLIGSTPGDQVGEGIVRLTNGNFLVRSPSWDNGAAADAGAVTWVNGTTGLNGVVSPANSLVGSTAGDSVGDTLGAAIALTNGNYVVSSPSWDNGGVTDAGAATWGNGSGGTVGPITPANSLVGSTAGDQVSGTGTNRIVALTNGNYVVKSQSWDNGSVADAGAVTWGNGTGGTVGAVTPANSLVGSTASDRVGAAVGGGVTALAYGNYVVTSEFWDDGPVADVGAATWGNGNGGTVGTVSAANSLVGSTASDRVGKFVVDLTNGHYVVLSNAWDNGTLNAAGAATWGNGNGGTVGPVSPANSLVGSSASASVGNIGVALANGNYVIGSSNWDAESAADVGAATWGNGNGGTVGPVTAANSLVGSAAGDQVGTSLTALTNGNYVVRSPNWDDGSAADVRAATWGDGNGGTVGPVLPANSLVGSTAADRVGLNVLALTNGNYVVYTDLWNNGSVADVGAVTWGNGAGGAVGAVTPANSLVGTTANDRIGTGLIALANGNYLVRSQSWDNGSVANAGAVTWGNGTGGSVGTVSTANSIVGSTANDQVAASVLPLSNGNFVFLSPNWDNGALANSGAATWGDGTNGETLDGQHVITPQNSMLGLATSPSIGGADDPANQAFLIAFRAEGSGRVVSAFTDPNLLTFARGAGASITVTPGFVARTLNAGTAVTLQATAALTLASALSVNNPGGAGGALTLQSQGAVALDAALDTDDAALLVQAPAITIQNGVTLTTGAAAATFGQGTLDLGGPAPAALAVNGGLAFDATLTYRVQINGAAPGAGFDALTVSGGLSLGGAALDVQPGFSPAAGQAFTLIDNQSGSAVSGTFAGLPEGTVFTASGRHFRISYKGGDGNDVTLTATTPAPTVVAFRVLYGNGKSYDLLSNPPRVLPWQITGIQVVFSEAVNGGLGSLSLSGIGAPVLSGFTGSGTDTLTWTFAAAVSAANLTASLASSGANAVTDLSGNALDGDPGSPGPDDFSQAVQLLYGDVNGSGGVNSTDASLVRARTLGNPVPVADPFLDVDGDGDVDNTDFNVVRGRSGSTLP